MATKVTPEDIIKINELYKKIGTYSGVAREVGFAPSTVKKYIKADFVPKEEIVVHHFEGPLPDFNPEELKGKDLSALCEMNDEELKEIKEFWKELEI